ncbi:thiamine phosphate synthase [Paraglaciecola sp.]|uniref:thiamine phosphate synthase n=1 Tax=Paraglaciecola sp. TaxID=1920173 RepID=UPI0030F38CF4
MTLDPFYPIVDSAHWVARLVPLGIKQIQLRIKNLDDDLIRNEIQAAKAVCEQYQCTLIINDHWQLAIEQNCQFIHLGQEDLADADLGAIRQAGLRLGLSSHDLSELGIAVTAKPDYIALGPVYPTVLKKMKWHQQGLERVSEWKQLLGNIPLVAIGGMTVERAAGALTAGADIVSAVSDISLNADPEQRVRQWLAVTRERVQ